MIISKIIIIPLIVGVIAQLLKLIPQALKGKFNLRDLMMYGGMPSGHAAFVVSVATMAALEEGMDSTVFAVAVLFSVVIIRDSIGFRQIMGLQSRAINKISNKVFSEEEKLPFIRERLGHTWSEVIVGALVGTALTLLINYLFFS
ncbi:MAG: acid phosphatase [Candidatus Kerfeldbacteria bacterium CG_4_10_14_0_8_um_filter_42_10]|uniref:Acid phosphatase n=1 Tax=Candidatus Kerfeldbacteria bacterium CG_4_10_14_0_8_um_filter_42_10 TaxID=2014248 RepID=A0A2M7RK34_9BACT|nr:MAG: acid phosphatase [Candidatus Kerfeldbacteria bacterium CG_4_10_14_0_8_um_filter_42_10]